MNLSNATLTQVSVHLVGNKGNGEEFIVSKHPVELSENDLYTLKDSFLSKFSLDMDRYSFFNATSLNYNEVYNFCLDTLAESNTFHANSVNIAKHLYESSTHPKIKAGDLYVCYFEHLRLL